jgi:hypothetical protein
MLALSLFGSSAAVKKPHQDQVFLLQVFCHRERCPNCCDAHAKRTESITCDVAMPLKALQLANFVVTVTKCERSK